MVTSAVSFSGAVVLLSFGPRSPTEHVTVLPPPTVQVPVPPPLRGSLSKLAEMIVRSSSRSSVIVTPVAVAPPVFLAVME